MYRKKSDKPTELLERGKTKKRITISRAKEEESLEEIKEYIYNSDVYTDEIIKNNLHNIYDDI